MVRHINCTISFFGAKPRRSGLMHTMNKTSRRFGGDVTLHPQGTNDEQTKEIGLEGFMKFDIDEQWIN